MSCNYSRTVPTYVVRFISGFLDVLSRITTTPFTGRIPHSILRMTPNTERYCWTALELHTRTNPRCYVVRMYVYIHNYYFRVKWLNSEAVVDDSTTVCKNLFLILILNPIYVSYDTRSAKRARGQRRSDVNFVMISSHCMTLTQFGSWYSSCCSQSSRGQFQGQLKPT